MLQPRIIHFRSENEWIDDVLYVSLVPVKKVILTLKIWGGVRIRAVLVGHVYERYHAHLFRRKGGNVYESTSAFLLRGTRGTRKYLGCED